MYHETRGLELRYNSVLFEDAVTLSAIDQCVCVLRGCGGLLMAAVKPTLSSFASSEGRHSFHALVRQCVASPHASVRVHLPYWSQADPSFVLLGLAYLYTVRRDSRLIAKVAGATGISYLAKTDYELLGSGSPMPLNLRFLPLEHHFNQGQLMLGLWKVQANRLVLSKDVLGEIEDLVRQWFSVGL